MSSISNQFNILKNIESILIFDTNINTYIETLILCNRENNEGLFKIRISNKTTRSDLEEYIYYNHYINSNDTIFLNLELDILKNQYLNIESTVDLSVSIVK